MTQTLQAISPLRQRMIDDMRMRQLAPKTQANYLRIVREFTRFLGRSPDTASVEDLRGYQLHLVDHGTSPISLNAAITGLKFFFEITLHEPDLMARMQPVRVPRTLPVVLSPAEVGRPIAVTGNLKHQTALSVAYGAHRAGQGPQGSVCDALTGAAGAPACLVAGSPCTGQDARWRMVVSGS